MHGMHALAKAPWLESQYMKWETPCYDFTLATSHQRFLGRTSP